jgi:D-alanyl-D-alanine carboxypeptidase
MVMSAILESYYKELGIDSAVLAKNRLSFCEQANLQELQVVDIDFAGRPFILTSQTAVAWRRLTTGALSEKIPLRPASGFRSYLYQKKLIEGKLAAGRSLADILTANALPGYSEHHTGRAIDIAGDSMSPDDQFHKTDTYLWMLENAARFQFRLSYPQDNQYGIIFEPWHWYFVG